MQRMILRCIPVGLMCLAFITAAHAQSDAAKIFKSNCTTCHSVDGSGDSATGKALKAKDLRSDEVQVQSDDALNETITKGKGKMPAFGNKLKPDEVKGLVAYVRGLKK